MLNQYLIELAEALNRTVIETNDMGKTAGKVAFIDGMVSHRELRNHSEDYFILSEVCYWEKYDATQFTALPKDSVTDVRSV